MTDFSEKIHQKGQAEEDIFFAKLDRQLIQALHDKQRLKNEKKSTHSTDVKPIDTRVKHPNS